MHNIIVVLGSVTSKQYRDIRLPYVARGQKVKIVRLANDDLTPFIDEAVSREDFPPGYPDSLIGEFCRKHDIIPEHVIEVVALASEYKGEYPGIGAGSKHAFDASYEHLWPRLRHVSLWHEGDWFESI